MARFRSLPAHDRHPGSDGSVTTGPCGSPPPRVSCGITPSQASLVSGPATFSQRLLRSDPLPRRLQRVALRSRSLPSPRNHTVSLPASDANRTGLAPRHTRTRRDAPRTPCSSPSFSPSLSVLILTSTLMASSQCQKGRGTASIGRVKKKTARRISMALQIGTRTAKWPPASRRAVFFRCRMRRQEFDFAGISLN